MKFPFPTWISRFLPGLLIPIALAEPLTLQTGSFEIPPDPDQQQSASLIFSKKEAEDLELLNSQRLPADVANLGAKSAAAYLNATPDVPQAVEALLMARFGIAEPKTLYDGPGSDYPKPPEKIPKPVKPRFTKGESVDEITAGVGLIVPTSAIRGRGTSRYLDVEQYGIKYRLCDSDHPEFRNYCVGASATGFLISKNNSGSPLYVVTAGHVVDKGKGATFSIVFGFNQALLKNQPYEDRVYLSDEVEVCPLELIHKPAPSEYDFKGDWAILKPLAAPKRKPLAVNPSSQLPSAQDRLLLIGHPRGLPQRVASNGRNLGSSQKSPLIFLSDLNAFSGNSGSPVINQTTWEVEGLLIAGDLDFVSVGRKTCQAWFRVGQIDAKHPGEKILKIRAVCDAIDRF